METKDIAEDDWKRIAGSIIDTVYLTNEDYVNEKLVEQLRRYFSEDRQKLSRAEALIARLRDALTTLLRDSMRSDYTVRRTAFEQARAALAQPQGGEDGK